MDWPKKFRELITKRRIEDGKCVRCGGEDPGIFTHVCDLCDEAESLIEDIEAKDFK